MDGLTPRGFHFYEGEKKWLARGVTYGPFRPNREGYAYPEPDRLREDLAAIRQTGANAVRLYALPGESLAAQAAEQGLRLLVDVPWPRHLDVYDNRGLQDLCLKMVRESVCRLRDWPLMGVLLGNEIPADLARWAGAGRVEEFLRRLYGEAKEHAPDLLFGFANFPSTEYLDLGFFDFAGFNLYLHDPAVFQDYLIRLRHLYPEKPLVLSELGMDARRHGQEGQAKLLSTHLPIVYETGLAGAFVFSWTDEWFTGGYEITDWEFGLVDRDRRPKAARAVAADIFQKAPQCREAARLPRVSVVVATYNGGRTLRECLRSLENLRYPDYETIVVDDGSTDDTPEILADFPSVRVITQSNQGLSCARNAGIAAANGEMVAFTDSDCFADPDWLYHLVLSMEQGNFAGMGGPNLAPLQDGAAARCIALAPGHATHVLLGTNEAEHVPGCNMAFRRDILLKTGGFDPVFRQAGDDVDMIWRLQDSGHRIGFSTAAFVWHYRRPTVRGYLRQQMGYGRAEALLLRKHPHRFNDRGQSIWRGVIYASKENPAVLARPDIHYGVFGSAGYQCIYEKPGSPWLHLAVSLEWWILCGAFFLLGSALLAPPLLKIGLVGMGISAAVSGFRAWRRWRAAPLRPAFLFPLVWFFWMIQPVVRGGMRYWTRGRGDQPSTEFRERLRASMGASNQSLTNRHVLEYWGEEAPERLNFLHQLTREMSRQGWIFAPNTGWEPWDLSVAVTWWFRVLVASAEENHGGRRRLLRLRFRLSPASLLGLLAGAGLISSLAVWSYNSVLSRLLLVALLLSVWFLYHQARRGRALVENLADTCARLAGFAPFEAKPGQGDTKERNPLRKPKHG